MRRPTTTDRSQAPTARTLTVPGLVATAGLFGLLLAALAAPAMAVAIAAGSVGAAAVARALDLTGRVRRHTRGVETPERVCIPGTGVCVQI